MEKLKRRADDHYEVEMDVIDDTDPKKLTVSEIKELKRLANMSKLTRNAMVIAMGLIGVFGLPAIWDFLKSHLK